MAPPAQPLPARSPTVEPRVSQHRRQAAEVRTITTPKLGRMITQLHSPQRLNLKGLYQEVDFVFFRYGATLCDAAHYNTVLRVMPRSAPGMACLLSLALGSCRDLCSIRKRGISLALGASKLGGANGATPLERQRCRPQGHAGSPCRLEDEAGREPQQEALPRGSTGANVPMSRL